MMPINKDNLKQGYKADENKPRMDLISPYSQQGLAEVLTYGANKYADRNWEKGMLYHRCYGAMMRHMLAWWAGEDKDPESGLSHLDHASACIHFLQHYEKTGQFLEFDDRPEVRNWL